jgi:uncharacterized protein YcfL
MKLAMSFAFMLLAAAGCATHATKAEPPHRVAPQPAAQSQAVTDSRVVMDPALEHAIHVVRIKAEPGAAGYLRIQLNVQNLTDSPKHFSYRIEWFDRDGGELPLAALSWLPWTLLSHETSLLAATAPTPAARDFRVTFSAN